MAPQSGAEPSLVVRLHERAGAERWGLSVRAFQNVIEASAAHAFAGRVPTADELNRHVDSLHLEDLALAAACAAGHEAAWDHFVNQSRPALYRAADAIDPTGGARELADSLYADLYGLREREGERQSLFRYFHGRSTLGTWLRAVLAQRCIDRLRSVRNLDPLPDENAGTAGTPAVAAMPEPDFEQPRFMALMRIALTAAIRALAPRDRLRLSCYYVQDLTLAEIGRLLGEHEATVSRHLTRIRRALRADVEETLRQNHRLDDASIAECFQSVMDDPGSLDVAKLVTVTTDGKIARPDRS
jgi:RNA polymerase sigma-70 factor